MLISRNSRWMEMGMLVSYQGKQCDTWSTQTWFPCMWIVLVANLWASPLKSWVSLLQHQLVSLKQIITNSYLFSVCDSWNWTKQDTQEEAEDAQEGMVKGRVRSSRSQPRRSRGRQVDQLCARSMSSHHNEICFKNSFLTGQGKSGRLMGGLGRRRSAILYWKIDNAN